MVKTAVTVVAAAGLSVGSAVGVADAATAHAQKGVSKSDVAFLKSNEQVNLAEITLAKIVLTRSDGLRAVRLARVTMKDHERTMTANKKIAARDGITLPTQPNATQKAAAAKLSKVRRVALTYFKIQITGHKLSIKQTEHEIRDGHRSNIRSYAEHVYLPVAEKHLTMSEKDLAHYRSTH